MLLAANGSSSESKASHVRNNRSDRSIFVKVKEIRKKRINLQGLIDIMVELELAEEPEKYEIFYRATDLLKRA